MSSGFMCFSWKPFSYSLSLWIIYYLSKCAWFFFKVYPLDLNQRYYSIPTLQSHVSVLSKGYSLNPATYITLLNVID